MLAHTVAGCDRVEFFHDRVLRNPVGPLAAWHAAFVDHFGQGGAGAAHQSQQWPRSPLRQVAAGPDRLRQPWQ